MLDITTINTESARQHLRLGFAAFDIAGLDTDPDDTREPVTTGDVQEILNRAVTLINGRYVTAPTAATTTGIPPQLLCPQSLEVVDRDGNENWVDVDTASPDMLREMIACAATRAALLQQAATEATCDVAALIAVASGASLVTAP